MTSPPESIVTPTISTMMIPNSNIRHMSHLVPACTTNPVWLSPFQFSHRNHDPDQDNHDDDDGKNHVYGPTLTVRHEEESGFVVTPPKRVLGFDPSLGRGFVYSTDQTPLGRPEFLFLDTPGNPDLQILCSMIITKYTRNRNSNADDTSAFVANLRRLSADDDNDDDYDDDGVDGSTLISDEEVAPHLTLTFATRYINPNRPHDLPLKKLIEDIYFDGRDLTYGIIVKIPAMYHHKHHRSSHTIGTTDGDDRRHAATLANMWGSGGYTFPNEVTKASLDNWIELVCMDYYASSMF